MDIYTYTNMNIQINQFEDEEHFFFRCQKSELLRKEFLTQIENLYTKLMGNNHIQNFEYFISASFNFSSMITYSHFHN
jgi:hypothetical protein